MLSLQFVYTESIYFILLEGVGINEYILYAQPHANVRVSIVVYRWFVLFLFDLLKKSNALRFWFALVVFAYESATYSATMDAISESPTIPE